MLCCILMLSLYFESLKQPRIPDMEPGDVCYIINDHDNYFTITVKDFQTDGMEFLLEQAEDVGVHVINKLSLDEEYQLHIK